MSDGGRFKIGTFSRLTGFSPAVLRAWERRHGILEPERPGGGHRLYTEDDLAVIRRVAELLDEGRSISEVAALGREALMASELAPEPPVSAAWDRLGHLRDEVVRAAVRIDDDRLRASLDEVFAISSPRVAVERVVIPAVREIGARWHEGSVSVAGEHLVSANLRYRLYQLLEVVRRHRGHLSPVLCACPPAERHELGLLTVSLLLASAGRRVLYLGADVPVVDIEQTLRTREIGAVFLSATRVEPLTACADDLATLARRWGPSVDFHLGGLAIAHAPAVLGEAGIRLWAPTRTIEELANELTEVRAPRRAGGHS